MNESTMDLFCEHEDERSSISKAFIETIEILAAEAEVTVDYYIMEFM